MFITFEGTEGCGKSVQAEAIAAHLRDAGWPVVHTREPGGTQLGERLREVLLHTDNLEMGAVAELLLFSAARSQHVAEIINPGLRAGKIVVCDRFADSSVAYQAYGRGLDRRQVETVQHLATGGLTPDLTFLLDIEPLEGLRRKARGHVDRIERMDLGFHTRVRHGYLTIAAEDPSRWQVLDGTLAIDDLAELVHQRVDATLAMSRTAIAKSSG